MDLESLKTKVTEAGGTQFESLSQRTIDHVLGREIKRNSEDSYYTDEVIGEIVEDLKEMDGNLHFEVGKRNTEYKTKFEKEWKAKHPDVVDNDVDGNDDNETAKALKALQERFDKMEQERKEAAKKTEKESLLKSVKEGLKAKFSSANVEPNEFILNITMRELSIPDEGADAKSIIKSAETAYYKNLKEAGLEDTRPRGGGGGGGNAVSTYWAKKKAREGFGGK